MDNTDAALASALEERQGTILDPDHYDPENEVHVRKRKKKLERARQHELADIATLMEMPEFRYFVWRILNICGLYNEPFDIDPILMARRVSRQGVGQDILREVLTAGEEAYSILRTEGSVRQIREGRTDD